MNIEQGQNNQPSQNPQPVQAHVSENQASQEHVTPLQALFTATALTAKEKLSAVGFSDEILEILISSYPNNNLIYGDTSHCTSADSAFDHIIELSKAVPNTPVTTLYNGAALVNTYVNGFDEIGIVTPDSSIRNCSFYRCDARGCHIEESIFNTDFTGTDLRNAVFISPIIFRCSFRNADLRGIEFKNCAFIECDFSKALIDENTKGIPEAYLKQTVTEKDLNWFNRLLLKFAA